MTMEQRFVPFDEFEQRDEEGRHIIEGICVPYGVTTDRVGGMPERFERGAFADLVTSGARVKLTDYNHARNRVPVGYSAVFEERTAGLWARFRLNRTPEGESARANVVEGVYQGLSVGFIPRAEEIRGGVRHVTSARLDHVSLVEVPAYEDARILAVRGSATDLDALRALAQTPPSNVALDLRPREMQTLLMSKIRRRA